MDDMLETMYAAPGIGLAAIQIGVPKQVIVIDVSGEDEKDPLCLANPRLVWTSTDQRLHEEGCLSVPDYYEEITRPEKCRVRYLDRNGREEEIEAEGLLATCLQHEMDHLNGKLFIDYLSKLKRDRVLKKFAKQARQLAVHMPQRSVSM